MTMVTPPPELTPAPEEDNSTFGRFPVIGCGCCCFCFCCLLLELSETLPSIVKSNNAAREEEEDNDSDDFADAKEELTSSVVGDVAAATPDEADAVILLLLSPLSNTCLANDDATFFTGPAAAVEVAVVVEEKITSAVVVVVVATPLFSFPAPGGKSFLNSRDRLFAKGDGDVPMYSTSETGDDKDSGGSVDLDPAVAVLVTAAEAVVAVR